MEEEFKLRYESGMTVVAKNKAVEIATDMLKDKEPLEKIAKYTKLNLDELLALKQSLDL